MKKKNLDLRRASYKATLTSGILQQQKEKKSGRE